MPNVMNFGVENSNTAVVTGTFPSSSGDVLIDYPAGFSADNCFIVSAAYEVISGRWDTLPNTISGANINFSCRTDKIYCFTSASNLYSKNFKLLLIKV